MRAIRFVLTRYWLPREGNFLSFSLWLSVVGVALGVAQLMVVLSVMSGFLKIFTENYTRISSDLVVIPRNRTSDHTDLPVRLKRIPGIEGVTPSALGQGMVLKKSVGGVVIEGIDPDTSGTVTDWTRVWVEAPDLEAQRKEPYWIWLGSALAKKLSVTVGDSVDLLVAQGSSRKTVPFKVTGITKFGIHDHDLRYVRVDLRVFQELFRRHHWEPFYKCRLAPRASLDAVVAFVKSTFGKDVAVKRWNEVHQNVFLAVEHQKRLLFLILQIVVALAAMNVVNLLLMSAHHRKRDIAIWRAMGMRFSQVVSFYVIQGTAVGMLGVISGVGLGVLACAGLRMVQPALLSESVYNVTRLPVEIRPDEVAIVAAAGLLLCFLFSLLPALVVARRRSVEALRWE